MSTEDGRILLYSTNLPNEEDHGLEHNESIPTLEPVAQIGEGLTGRIKDFEILEPSSNQISTGDLYFVSASSNGAICIWALGRNDLFEDIVTSSRMLIERQAASKNSKISTDGTTANSLSCVPTKQIGRLLGKYDTGHRITCLKAFLMKSASEATSVILR